MRSFAKAPLPDLYRGMNRTEKARAIELEAMRRAGKIAAWWYERWTFKLADDTRYTPDLIVQENDGSLRAEEIKGFLREDANVKMKIFAALFPLPLTVLYRKNGEWETKKYGLSEAA